MRLTSPDYDWLLCSSECSNTHYNQLINEYYANLVYALNNATARTILVILCSALKPFWNDYLDELEEKSIFWQNIWVSSGKMLSGYVHHIRNSSKLRYKLAIRKAILEFETQYDDELLAYFVRKEPSDFWKTWNKKYKKNYSEQVYINGLNNASVVANAFADSFCKIYNSVDCAPTTHTVTYHQVINWDRYDLAHTHRF